MTVPFDIFQAESDGTVLWIRSAQSVAEAQARIHEQAAQAAGEYLVVNQETGSKQIVRLNDSDLAA